MITSIALINKSSKSTEDVQAFARAMNKQIVLHLAPVWQRYAVCWMAKEDAHIGAEAWTVFLYDEPRNQEDATALGHHETRGTECVPVGYVFIKGAERSGTSWTVIASHEILDMLGDAWMNDTVTRYMPGNALELWPREICDAVQGQSYEIEGIAVSNFLYPAAFVDRAQGPYDYLRTTSAPFQVTKGGYSTILRITESGTQQVNLYGHEYPDYDKGVRPLSRKAKRFASLGFPVEDHIVT